MVLVFHAENPAWVSKWTMLGSPTSLYSKKVYMHVMLNTSFAVNGSTRGIMFWEAERSASSSSLLAHLTRARLVRHRD